GTRSTPPVAPDPARRKFSTIPSLRRSAHTRTLGSRTLVSHSAEPSVLAFSKISKAKSPYDWARTLSTSPSRYAPPLWTGSTIVNRGRRRTPARATLVLRHGWVPPRPRDGGSGAGRMGWSRGRERTEPDGSRSSRSG